jgi:hypothetical protein
MIASEREIWLYGSAARGDSDDLSDVDLLLIDDDDDEGAPLNVELSPRASITRYSWAEVEHMVSYGSLFLHHVKLEGKPVQEGSDKRFRSLLSALPAYRRAEQEMASFESVVDDVERSLNTDHSPQFELAVLATAARHAAILAAYLIGQPEFSRKRVFRHALPALRYGVDEVASFEVLYDYRVFENHQLEVTPPPSSEDVRVAVERVRELIRRVRELV